MVISLITIGVILGLIFGLDYVAFRKQRAALRAQPYDSTPTPSAGATTNYAVIDALARQAGRSGNHQRN